MDSLFQQWAFVLHNVLTTGVVFASIVVLLRADGGRSPKKQEQPPSKLWFWYWWLIRAWVIASNPARVRYSRTLALVL